MLLFLHRIYYHLIFMFSIFPTERDGAGLLRVRIPNSRAFLTDFHSTETELKIHLRFRMAVPWNLESTFTYCHSMKRSVPITQKKGLWRSTFSIREEYYVQAKQLIIIEFVLSSIEWACKLSAFRNIYSYVPGYDYGNRSAGLTFCSDIELNTMRRIRFFECPKIWVDRFTLRLPNVWWVVHAGKLHAHSECNRWIAKFLIRTYNS